MHSIEFNNDRQKQVEEQLTTIYDPAHQQVVQDLPQILTHLKQQLENLLTITEQLKKAQITEKELERSYLEAANELTLKRKLAAISLIN